MCIICSREQDKAKRHRFEHEARHCMKWSRPTVSKLCLEVSQTKAFKPQGNQWRLREFSLGGCSPGSLWNRSLSVGSSSRRGSRIHPGKNLGYPPLSPPFPSSPLPLFSPSFCLPFPFFPLPPLRSRPLKYS